MPRLARVVVPGAPHHVTQRGNRRLPVFFGDDDRHHYLALLARACSDNAIRCLAWCLMDNHVHLILVPATLDELRATLGETHRRYARRVNFREGWRGYLFQGRFASYPMDDAHLMVALRYVERNPVAAGLVARVEGRRVSDDLLTNLGALGQHVKRWRAMLAIGLEASDDDGTIEEIKKRMRTGRLLANAEWIAEAERMLGRKLGYAKRGPKLRESRARVAP